MNIKNINKIFEQFLDEDRINKIIELVEYNETVQLFLNNRKELFTVEYLIDDIEGEYIGLMLLDEDENKEDITWEELFNQKFQFYILERKKIHI